MASSSSQRHKEWNSNTLGSTINQKSALSAAYAELGKELTSGKLKSIGSYTMGKIIGEGTFGKVRLGTHRLTGTRVAIKQVPKAHSASLTREIHHHRRLHHPNVMQLYEVLATESYIWMVTELCAGGELYDYLVERSTMHEPEARRIFGQLCLAVAYVHERGIVHRDLKLENVLLDEKCNVKLGDFGFTREYEAKRLMETYCGTTGYAAPEMLAGRKYTGQEVDIWSLGVILYALLCGALPFDDDDESVMKDKILKGDFELPEGLSEESRSLITDILQQDASKRPSIKKILDHAWFHKVMITTPMSTVEEDENEVLQNDGFFPTEKEEREGRLERKSTESQHSDVKRTASPLVMEQTDFKDHYPSISASSFVDKSLYSAQSKSDSESSDHQSSKTEITEPTTEEGDEEMQDIVSHLAASSFSAERGTLALHWNESQSTLRRQGSGGSDASRKASSAATAAGSSLKATSLPLPTHHEAPTLSEQPQSEDGRTLAPQSFPLEKRGSQSSSRGHHRTPSRTKRISTGSLSEPIPPILDFRPTDYIALLEQSSPAMFSTIKEQNILHQLSSLGMDVGQIVHSVINEACDASGAMWWILKKKAEEREESDMMYSPLSGGGLSLVSPPPPLPPKDPTRSQPLPISSPPILDAVVSAESVGNNNKIIKPSPVYATLGSLGLPNSPISGDRSELIRRSTSPVITLADSPSKMQKKSERPTDRHRASSLSLRLSSVLSGKDKESKKESADSVLVGGEQLNYAERSKSPVGNLLTKMSGNSPTTAGKGEKEKRKDGGSKITQTSKLKDADEQSNQRSNSSSPSSLSRQPGDATERLIPSKSIDTFSTISSNTHEGIAENDAFSKSKPRSSFLSTFRTWFEDKDKYGTIRKKKQQQQQQQQQQQLLLQRSSKTVPHSPNLHIAHGPTNHHFISRNGSLRRTTGIGQYTNATGGSSSRRSSRHPSLGHRTSLSRRSSSASTSSQYPSIVYSPRPKATRRPSAGSITPTATINGDDLAYTLPYQRNSRPSSAQSNQRSFPSGGGLQGKTGSASSFNSLLKQQQSSMSGYVGGSSLRGAQGRRSSLDGGTTVRRHRNYHGSYHMARSDSSHSRPSTPSKLREGYSGAEDGSEGHALGLYTPRRLSLDSEANHGRASPMQTPRASQSPSVFVAHKHRTSYRPPSANASLHHRHERDSSSDQIESQSPHLRAWRRSWGKPPPFWAGPVDYESSLPTVRNKAKLRNVFANKESDDDWEDEEEEPMYAGGLGQLDSNASQSWSTTNNRSATPSKGGGGGGGGGGGRGGNESCNRQDGMPNHILGSTRYAGVRSIFQPPSLGRETSPKAWTTPDGLEATSAEDKKETNTVKDAANTNGPSRARAAAPAFKGADILEEDEEDE